MVNSIELVGIPAETPEASLNRSAGGSKAREELEPAGGAVIVIPKDVHDEMVAHAFQGLPNEACGLVAASDGRVERFYPLRNADQSPSTYRLDPKDQLEVFNEIEQKGWALFGIFHSHTHTEAFPSETDRRQAFYPEAYYLLLSLADRDRPVLRGFTIRDDTVGEQEVRIA